MTTLEAIKAKLFDRQCFATIDDEYNYLAGSLYSYWTANVSKNFCPVNECLAQSYDEEKAYQQLIKPLEWYITQHENPKELFDKLKSLAKPPSMCGKVFKLSEANYHCRDCATDPTCVLCAQCFLHSEHRNHRYRIGSSTSGYCDCGDPEAWKGHSSCTIHSQEQDKAAFDSGLSKIMSAEEFENLLKRLSIVLSVTLDYSYVLFRWNTSELPVEFSPSSLIESDLSKREFVAVLYNDEIHTYDNVIYALMKSIRCSNKVGTDYATTVDREGRAIIFHGSFEKCSSLKEQIAEITLKNSDRVLEVKVLCVHLVAHQNFATRLLNWLKELMTICEEFRVCLAKSVFAPGHNSRFIKFSEDFVNNPSLCEKIMLSDTKFWKSIRVLWDKTFISSFLFDLELKKQFSKLFARNYPEMMANYIVDDHEHFLSISSLSVQIFTVPSLSRLLIEEENILEEVINTFLKQTQAFHENGQFKFEFNAPLVRRSYQILHDVKHLLTKPTESFEWTEGLRAKFFDGIKALVKLTKMMQGMDSITRHVSQHIEYEPAWDNGINLQFRISPIIKSLLPFLLSDRQLFLDTLNYVLKLYKGSFEYYCSQSRHQSVCVTKLVHIDNYSAFVWDYDVSRQEVSIHYTLSRFMAALLLYLPRFGISYNDMTCTDLIANRLPPESLFELPLRTQVLVSQFRTGMWRRNGYSLVNQILFYHNVRLREEMYDRDIHSLQIGASIMDANEFLLHIINKFQLFFFLEEDFKCDSNMSDDKLRFMIGRIDEFLRLIYTLVTERYHPELANVTLQDCIRYEVIHWLCRESMSNSELSNQFPSEYELDFEDVVTTLADFKKPPPGSNTHGKYVLKEEYHSRFNPFFYHYTRQDQSTAVENEMKRNKKLKKKYLCCPPPPLPDFRAPYESIRNLLNCDVMINCIKAVLRNTCSLEISIFSDVQFQCALYLIGLALNEEAKNPQKFSFTKKAIDSGIRKLLDNCRCVYVLPRIELHKDLLDWILNRFTEVTANNDASTSFKLDESESHRQVESEEKIKRREMAAARKNRVLEQIKAMQMNFMKENSEYFKSKEEDGSDSENAHHDTPMETDLGPDPVAVGMNQCRNKSPLSNPEGYVCILCLEQYEMKYDGTKKYDNRLLLLSAYVQNSTVLSQNRNSERSNYINPCFVAADHKQGLFINTCTHYMHNDCFEKYIETTAYAERRRSTRYARISFDISKHEFLCPLCECLCNVVIPVTPHIRRTISPASIQTDLSMDRWLQGMHLILQDCNLVWLLEVSTFPAAFTKNYSSLIEKFPPDLKQVFEAIRAEYSANSQPALDATASCKKIRNSIFEKCLLNVFRIFKQTNELEQLELNSKRYEMLQCMNWSISYSIQIMERSMRVDEQSFSSVVDTRFYQCFKTLIGLMRSLNYFELSTSRQIFMLLMNYLLINTVYISSPFSCIDLDAFTLLVTLILTAPSLFNDTNLKNPDHNFLIATGSSIERNIIEMMHVFHMIQIIVTNPRMNDSEEPMEVDSEKSQSTEQSNVLLSFCKDVWSAAGNTNYTVPSAAKANYFIKSSMLPFLRSTAIFTYFHSEVRLPKAFWDKSVKLNPADEYDMYCGYLGIPKDFSILLQTSLKQLALSWMRHSKIKSAFTMVIGASSSSDLPTDLYMTLNAESIGLKQPHRINTLEQLPHDFMDLMNSLSSFTCPNSKGEESRSPCLCLVCGQVICSQNYCCQKLLKKEMIGACTYHALHCGAGTGLFLRVRDCKMLLLAGRGRGCYLPAPYVDKYGETDQGLSRGDPLFLSEPALKQFYKLWLRHEIPEQVSRMLELSHSMSSMNWSLL